MVKSKMQGIENINTIGIVHSPPSGVTALGDEPLIGFRRKRSCQIHHRLHQES